MAFTCDQCHKPQHHGARPIKRVVRMRQVAYDTEIYNAKGKVQRGKGQGRGWEIARELNVCKRCAQDTTPPECEHETKRVRARYVIPKRKPKPKGERV